MTLDIWFSRHLGKKKYNKIKTANFLFISVVYTQVHKIICLRSGFLTLLLDTMTNGIYMQS